MIGIRIGDKKINEIKQLWGSWFFRKDKIKELMDILEQDCVYRQMIFTSNQEYNEWKSMYYADMSAIRNSVWRDKIVKYIFDDMSDEKYVVAKYKKKIGKNTEDFLLKNYENYRKTMTLVKIVRTMGVDVCPYCNRNFIENYVIREDGGQKNAYFKGDLDHHYSKKEIPALALSFFNLVPSCKVCNHEKSDSIERTFYPFYDNEDNDYHFSIEVYDDGDTCDIIYEEPIEGIEEKRFDATVWQGISDNFKIKLNVSDGKQLCNRMENSKEIFHLEKKYNHSKGYVKELIRKRYIYSETHKDILLKNFAEIFADEKQITETLFSYSDSEEYLHNRPLSKLTKDILLQIGVGIEYL